MRASLTNLPFLGKISNGNVRYLNGAGGKYNNFGKPNALGRYTPLESQARYYSRCREEANLTQGRSVYERGGGIDKKKEAQTKYERKGGKSGMENRRSAKQQWGTLGADYNRGIQGIKGGTKERYGERVEKAKRPGADFGQILRWRLQIWGVVRHAVMNGSAAMTFVMCCHECWFLTDMGDVIPNQLALGGLCSWLGVDGADGLGRVGADRAVGLGYLVFGFVF
ncbi:hypothetical protein U1Q18_043531 [Sarracenia purpurea var. burkii]